MQPTALITKRLEDTRSRQMSGKRHQQDSRKGCRGETVPSLEKRRWRRHKPAWCLKDTARPAKLRFLQD